MQSHSLLAVGLDLRREHLRRRIMNLFGGLSAKQAGAIRHGGGYHELAAGQLLFRQGDPAEGMYAIVSGKLEIYRQPANGQSETIAHRESGDIVGEMGILMDTGVRTASVRALENSLLFQIPRNPVDLLGRIGEEQAANKLLKNLLALLSERLREASEPASAAPSKGMKSPLVGYESDPEAALKRIEKLLPRKGLIRKVTQVRHAKPGEILCKQGDTPDGFYLLHSGNVRIEQTSPGPESAADGASTAQVRVIGCRTAPALLGDAGYFAGEPRMATVIAEDEIAFTFFSGRDFETLEKNSPAQAREVLHASALWMIHMIYGEPGAAG